MFPGGEGGVYPLRPRKLYPPPDAKKLRFSPPLAASAARAKFYLIRARRAENFRRLRRPLGASMGLLGTSRGAWGPLVGSRGSLGGVWGPLGGLGGPYGPYTPLAALRAAGKFSGFSPPLPPLEPRKFFTPLTPPWRRKFYPPLGADRGTCMIQAYVKGYALNRKKVCQQPSLMATSVTYEASHI